MHVCDANLVRMNIRPSAREIYNLCDVCKFKNQFVIEKYICIFIASCVGPLRLLSLYSYYMIHKCLIVSSSSTMSNRNQPERTKIKKKSKKIMAFAVLQCETACY